MSFDKLKRWLNIKDNMKIFNRPQRGIYSTENIKKGVSIIKIKSKFLIEYNKIYKKYPIEDIEEKNSLVAYFLVIENNKKDSFWKEYINSLPENLDEFLYYWDDKKINLLKNTSMTTEDFYSLDDHLECLISDYEIINSYNKENNILNINDDDFFNEYIRMRILVGSRIFGYKKDNEDESGIVPYVDMINHSVKSNTTWYYDDEKKSFILEAIKNIPKGEEIVDDYGDKNNIDFLLYYGFTLKDNENPILRIKLKKEKIEFNKTNYHEIINNNNKDELLKNLIKISKNHKKNIDKNKNIDQNIINIYNDEIEIINKILHIL